MCNRKGLLHNRILSAILAVVLLLSCVPVFGAAEDNSLLYITYEGEAVSTIEVPRNMRRMVTAMGLSEAAEYQWQIALPNNEGWVDILGQETQNMTVSLALTASIMDDNGVAYVRCTATDNGVDYISEPVEVKITAAEEILVPDIPVATTVTQEENDEPMETVAESSTAVQEAVSAVQEFVSGEGKKILDLFQADEATPPASEPVKAGRAIDTVTITITYQQETIDGKGNLIWTDVEWDNYEATIAKGTVYKIQEKLPSIPGYKPYLLKENVPEDAPENERWEELSTAFIKELSAEDTQQNVLITVYYRRQLVSYKVRYYMQEVETDNYVLNPNAVNGMGLPGDRPTVEDVRPYFEGFTNLFYEPEEIAADGSTEFEVYYDRNYYLINFDQDGGYGTAPVYARYESSYTPENPTRHGYVFQGWDLVKTETMEPYKMMLDADSKPVMKDDNPVYLDENGVELTDSTNRVYNRLEDPTNPDIHGTLIYTQVVRNYEAVGPIELAKNATLTIPSYNCTYKARWAKENTTYTIAYWLQNANDDNYSFVSSVSGHSALSGDTLTYDELDNKLLEFPKFPGEHPYTQEKLGNYVELDTDEIEAQYTEDDEGQRGVVVEGDGSTVFNVYFTRKVYKLQFYYAAEELDANGKLHTNDDDKNIIIVGGSTWYFGSRADNSGLWVSEEDRENEITVLDSLRQFEGGSQWGKVDIDTTNPDESARKYPPRLNAKGQALLTAGKYHQTTSDPDKAKYGWVYHYIWFEARYGQNIAELWPVDVFESVERAEERTEATYWTDKTAYVSAWNGEHFVEYTLNNTMNGGNQTIKGKYEKLDYRILFRDESRFAEDERQTVSYLCFWENGAKNIGWSIPELWVYRINVQGIDTTDYILNDFYATCDDSKLSGQTQVSLEGFTAEEAKKSEVESWYSDSALTSKPITKSFLEANNLPTTGYASYHIVDFYYTRNQYTLSYTNYDSEMTDREKTGVPYEKSLTKGNGYFFVPEIPSTLDPHSYIFDGWYTSPMFRENTKVWDKDGNYVKWDAENEQYEILEDENYQMPANDVMLYARWVPKIYKAEFFWNYDEMKKDIASEGTGKKVYRDASAKYNEHLSDNRYIDNPSFVAYIEPEDAYVNPKYEAEYESAFVFSGWFYEENGEQIAFDPNAMVYTQNMKLYAHWQTKKVTSYQVRYWAAVEDSNGNPVPAKAKKDAAGNVVRDSDGNIVLEPVQLDGNGKPLPGKENAPLEIAPSTTGKIFAATTKTFVAKNGEQLNTELTGLWLPHTRSHSILMDVNEERNTFEFLYLTRDSVHYTVEYRYKGSNELIPELDDAYVPGNPDNKEATGQDDYISKEAAVTRLPKYLSGYISSPRYVTLVLSFHEEQNVITFYYEKIDNEDVEGGGTGGGSTPPEPVERNHYVVHYMLQNLDRNTFSEQTVVSGTEDFGTIISRKSFTPGYLHGKEYSGYTYRDQITLPNGKMVYSGPNKEAPSEPLKYDEFGEPIIGGIIGENVVEMWIFYEINEYPYKVQYLLHENYVTGTDPVSVQNPDSGSAFFGQEITVEAPVYIQGYELINQKENKKDLTIAAESGDTPVNNVVTFYYQPREVVINYVAKVFDITPESTDGWLTLHNERPIDFADASTIDGSTPKSIQGYQFVAWYYDEACTQPVPCEEYDPNKNQEYNPALKADYVHPITGFLKPYIADRVQNEYQYEYTYYAKFEPIQRTLTIRKIVEGVDPCDDTFLFRITSDDALGGAVNMVVAVKHDDPLMIMDLYYGTYAVEELTNWSWQYEVAEGYQEGYYVELTLSKDEKLVVFANRPKDVDWLGGETSAENHFAQNEGP